MPSPAPKYKRPSVVTEPRKQLRGHGLLEAAGWLALLATGLGFFGQQQPLLDLVAHFRWQMAVIGLLALAVGAALRHLRLMALGVVLVIANSVPLFKGYNSPWPPPPANAQRLRVVVAHTKDGAELETLVPWVRSQAADVIVVLGLEARHYDVMRVAFNEFRGARAVTTTSGLGIGAWSSLPIGKMDIRMLDDPLLRILDMKVRIEGRDLRVVATQLFPPLGQRGSARNLLQLQDIVNLIGERDTRPTLLVGNLFTTPFAYRYRDFLDRSWLKSANDGQVHWPTWWPDSFERAWLVAPIDHALLRGDGFTVTGFALGPNVGAEHLPMVIDIGVPRLPR